MPGKSDTFEFDTLQLVFNGVAIPNVSDNAATSPATDIFVGLLNGDPDNGGTFSEVNYVGYARVAVPRTTAGWTVTTNASGNTTVKPVNDIVFPARTNSGSSFFNKVGFFKDASGGATSLLYIGDLFVTAPFIERGTQITITAAGTFIAES